MIIPEPLGHCLVIGAWNYPLQLVLMPAISALAAGNCVLIKPSEMAWNSALAIADLINSNFDPSEFHVANGDVLFSQKLLEFKFDKIFFTGSTNVGKIIAQAAAKNLTPVTLELGGKSPCLVTKDAHLESAARRIIWGKFLNAGQTCIAPDYLFVDAVIYDQFLQILKVQIEAIYGPNPKNAEHYPRIINQSHTQRLKKLLVHAKIEHGGDVDLEQNYISPTLVGDIHFDDPLMQEEIFGPILPVLKMSDLNQAIDYIKSQPKPLALYLFTEDKNLQHKFLNEISFGGGCVNDTVMHIGNEKLPFGGVGASGAGHYHGEFGFNNFSHHKAIVTRIGKFDWPFKFAPFRPWKWQVIRMILK